MLAYNSENDQYQKVLQPEFEEVPDFRAQLVLVSRPSSRSSCRSFRRNLFSGRIISKTGRLNTFLSKLPNKHVVFFRDLGNTLLLIQWRWIFATLFLVNLASFLLFGLLWMLAAFVSGDFVENVPESELCVVNVETFIGYVLLSIETIMTIGYGYRYPTEKCAQGWLLQIAQAFVSVALQGVLISVVYVKTAKPFTKNTKSIFSRNAVVCLREGKLCLIVRIIDVVGKILISPKISMYFIDKASDLVDEEQCFFMQEIKIEPYGFLIFPADIIHNIDSNSPLWTVTPFQLLTKRFEIVIVAEGISIITSQLSQNRTSYMASDILWGHRFEQCLYYNEDKSKFIVNYKKFNNAIQFNTPLCSAQELEMLRENFTEMEYFDELTWKIATDSTN